MRAGFYKADCTKNIVKPFQSRTPKRWMADDQDHGQCWPAVSTDGCSNRKKKKKKDLVHHMILSRKGRRSPKLLRLIAGSLHQSKPDFEK